MAPRRKQRTSDETEGPTIQQQDWDAIRAGKILPDSVPYDGDVRYDIEKDGEPPDEDDDTYQNSDEALPDDDEERATEHFAAKGNHLAPHKRG